MKINLFTAITHSKTHFHNINYYAFLIDRHLQKQHIQPFNRSLNRSASRWHFNVLHDFRKVKDCNFCAKASLNKHYNHRKREGNLTQTLYLLAPLHSDFISLTVFHQIPELCICILLHKRRQWRGTHSLDTFPPVTQELHKCLIPLWLSATLLSIVQCFI